MIPKALNALAPGAQWTSSGQTLEGITWLDKSIPRPSDEAITAKCEEFYRDAPLRFLRELRADLLRQSDWVVIKSQETGQPIPQEWKDYRQALRDLPKNNPNVQFGTGNNEVTNVNWPAKPQK